jgi:phosphatidylinositol alpha-1,6-mannosyltransferase
MVSSSFLPGRGGIESYLAELCRLLEPRLAVLASAEREGKPIPADLPYPTHPFPGRLLLPSRKAVQATVAAAQAEGTDRILFGTPWPLVLTGPKLKEAGLRFAVIVHGAELLVPSALPIVRRRLARALSLADLLLPVSDYTAERTRAFISRHGFEVPPIDLLRARVDLKRFRPDLDTKTVRERLHLNVGDHTILCFGRLVKRKGIHRMIKAMPEILRRAPAAVLVIAGTGPQEKRLRRLAAPFGRQVLFTGRVPDDDAPALYALADVFALPVVDRWRGLEIEGLGVVLLEAAAAGVPCVTGRSGGTPEAVLDGVTGYVIDASDRDALVNGVASLLENPAGAKKMGQAGRTHVAKAFSERSLPQSLMNWLESDARR